MSISGFAAAPKLQFTTDKPNDIPVNYMNDYAGYVIDNWEQKTSKVRGKFMEGTIKGEFLYFDGDGDELTLDEDTGRYQDTDYDNAEGIRRRISSKSFDKGFRFEEMDLEMLASDPRSRYVQRVSQAAGRKTDDQFFEDVYATVESGHEGETSIAWEDGVDGVNILGDQGSVSNVWTLDILEEMLTYLDEAEIPDDDLIYVFTPPHAVNKFIVEEDKVGSIDYNDVKALRRGKIDELMRFRFIKTNRVPTVSSGGNIQYHRCPIITSSSMYLGFGQELMIDLRQIQQFKMNWAMYVRIKLRALRLREEGVLEYQLGPKGGPATL